jgi:hypothetical protein
MENKVHPKKEPLEEELEVLKNAYDRTLRSCLMAGLLFIPEGLQCWNSDTDDDPEDVFVEELSDALGEQARGTIETLSTYLPIIVRGPSELVKEVRLLKFGDAHLLEVLQDRIDVIENRLALIKESVVQ